MKRERVQLILIIAVAALFFFGWRYYGELSKRAGRIEPIGVFPAAQEALKEPPVVEYTGVSFRDPFAMSAAVEARVSAGAQEGAPAIGAEELNLQGIVWEPEPAAIINNKVLKKGDRIDSVVLLDITPDGVTVSRAGERIFIKLKRR